jgi:carboxyl-terminal processing protease
VNRVQLEGAKAVIVDLRNNPGGLLTSAVHLGSEFVKGTIVKQEFSDGTVRSLEADHVGELLDIPLVVVINGGSASASEILAGAIKDNNRGEIIGEQSFGKGTVQDAVDLPGGAGLHVTIARWLTPKGTSIHEVGIEPDIAVELTAEDTEQKRDPQIDRALEIL